MPAQKVAELPLPDLLDRIDAARNADGKMDPVKASAMLGAVPKPAYHISSALNEFWRLAADRTLGKNDDQVRCWRSPRIKATGNFINVIGDIELSALCADDMLDFKDWWLDRVRSGDVSEASANKDFGHLADVLLTVNEGKRLGLTLPVRGWSIKQATARARPRSARTGSRIRSWRRGRCTD